MNRDEKLRSWIKDLNKAQLRELVFKTVCNAIEEDSITFWHEDSNYLSPFWSRSGDPIVDGQKVRVEDAEN